MKDVAFFGTAYAKLFLVAGNCFFKNLFVKPLFGFCTKMFECVFVCRFDNLLHTLIFVTCIPKTIQNINTLFRSIKKKTSFLVLFIVIDTIRLLKFTFFQMQYKNIKYNKPQLHQRCQLHSEQREEHQNK